MNFTGRNHLKHNRPCSSCKKGFNGKNGNGYQPCGRKRTPPSPPVPPPMRKVVDDGSFLMPLAVALTAIAWVVAICIT